MSTTTPMTRPVTTLDDLPRPRRHSLAGWATLWLAPEAARQQFAALGERFVMDVPLLPKMFWTTQRRVPSAGLHGVPLHQRHSPPR